MLHLTSSIEIRTGAERVWGILSDFAAYPSWNPFVRSIQGEHAPGSTLRVTVQPEGGSGMSFKPRLLAFISHRVKCSADSWCHCCFADPCARGQSKVSTP